MKSLLCWLGFAVLLSAAEKPNVLFLLSDDHSYPYLSCYGDANVRTPVLDKLAGEGIKFRRFFTSAPQCVPSRAAYLSGRSPVAARITRFSSPLPRDVVTFPEVLKKEAGYYVGVVGRSYHLDGSGKGDEGLGKFLVDGGYKTFPERFDVVQGGSDKEAVEQSAAFLEGRPKDKPFCLWVNFSDPHHAWTAPVSYRPDPASLKLPAHVPDLPAVREQYADYCAEVNRVDETVGKVLALLDRLGLAKDTLVVFAGDNGQALPHGKGSLYDPGCNVPFVVRWPGVVAPGGDSSALLSGEDLAPTVLAAVGLKPAAGMTGVSFLPILKGAAAKTRDYVFTERGPHGSAPVQVGMSNSGYDLSRAVRSGRYKAIYNCTPWLPYSPVDSAGGPAWKSIQDLHGKGGLAAGLAATYFTTPRPVYEFYDLEKDPAELNNLSGKPEVAEAERALRLEMAKKMIADFDYLPLPAIPGGDQPAKKGKGKAKADQAADRAPLFQKLDVDRDGKLSRAEFAVSRSAADAAEWFVRRDADGDGFISRAEFLPGSPLGKAPAAR
jgi:N-sulfoglucosamine sulfohydrolase